MQVRQAALQAAYSIQRTGPRTTKCGRYAKFTAKAGAPSPGSSSDTSEENIEAEYRESKRQIAELQAALAAVDGAIKQAEEGLEQVPSLPSSDINNLPVPPAALPLIMKAKGLTLVGAQVLVGALVLYGSQVCGWPLRILIGAFAGAGMGAYGYSRGSLDKSGSIAAAFVGACTLISSFRAAVVLLSFFFTSSKLTSYCEDRKMDDEDAKQGGQRNWLQVACNGFLPSLLVLASIFFSGGVDMPLQTAVQDLQSRRYIAVTSAFLGYYSCCCGDTWASEVGQLSDDTPRLITSLRPVRKGTNGGVTRLGLLASVLGGLCMGVAFYLGGLLSPNTVRLQGTSSQASRQLSVIFLGLFGGICGSLIDSLLGATVQFTGFNRETQKVTSKMGDDVTAISGLPFLSNNGVNLVSATLTAILCAVISLTALNPVTVA